MKLVKYKDRFRKKACPVCGCTHYVKHPEEWYEFICGHCGCTVEYVDKCFPQNIWDYIKAKKKIKEDYEKKRKLAM